MDMPTDLKSFLEPVDLHPQRTRNYWAEKGKSLIDENYSWFNSVQQISDALLISASHFRREFFNEFGVSPKRYLMLVRVHHACVLLKRSRLSINEIVREIGFRDRNILERSFKKLVGFSPSHYRLSFQVMEIDAQK